MSENKIDEFLRKKLQKHSSPVPGDMWERIQQKKDKDRKGFFFRWFLTGLIVIFLAAGYFIVHNNKINDNPKATGNSQQKTATQKDSNETGQDAEKKAPVKTNGKAVFVKKENNKLLTNKHPDINEKNIYRVRHQNKRAVTNQGFSASSILPDGHILKQKKESAKYIGTPRSHKGPVNIHIINATDFSIDNDQKDENIARKYRDTGTKIPAIKKTPLPADSLSKKTKTISENKSKKANELSPLEKKWFLEVYASPDVPFNEITSGNAATTDFIKKSFKTHLSYTLGVGIGRSINKHFSLKTGFQYSKIIAKMIDSNGVGIANHYMSLDVPFLIGYEIRNIDFETTINAGVIFNLYSWYKGNGIANYKNYAGVSLYTGLNFAKQINNKIELFAEPYFRYRLSYMTKPQAPFNQKINVAGALFGIKYNFQKRGQHK